MNTWKEEVAIVTGAASGIGRASAVAFARAGARVVVADVLVDGGEQTVEQIRREGGTARFARTDVSRPEEVKNLIDGTVKAFGRIDFAFNNAGIEGTLAKTADLTEAVWDKTIAVNLKGVWLCMKEELQPMLKRRKGVIINCASVAGLVGFPALPAYVASKHGVVGLTRATALEYALEGIRVNAICPGVIRTPMVDRFTGKDPQREAELTAGEPVGRMGTPEEVASMAVWLCTDGAAFVTGQAFAVDGGMTAR